MTTIPRGSCAVMARRAEPPNSLDWFPTPPWATRALLERVLFDRLEGDDWPMVVRRPELGRWGGDHGWPGFPVALSVLEPAAGEGRMTEVLREYFDRVHASDVFDYGAGYQVASFVGDGVDVLEAPAGGIDWVITNPPSISPWTSPCAASSSRGRVSRCSCAACGSRAPNDTGACSPSIRQRSWRNSLSACR